MQHLEVRRPRQHVPHAPAGRPHHHALRHDPLARDGSSPRMLCRRHATRLRLELHEQHHPTARQHQIRQANITSHGSRHATRPPKRRPRVMHQPPAQARQRDHLSLERRFTNLHPEPARREPYAARNTPPRRPSMYASTSAGRNRRGRRAATGKRPRHAATRTADGVTPSMAAAASTLSSAGAL